MPLTPEEWSQLKREIRRELVADLIRLLGDDPPAVPASAPQPWPPYQPPGNVRLGGCSACERSGVCNCILGGPQIWCTTGAAAPVSIPEIHIAPGTSRMIPAPNAGACAPGLTSTWQTFTTGQPAEGPAGP